MPVPVEIERKYIIEMPPSLEMEKEKDYSVSDITQIYLESEKGVTRRVRKRVFSDRVEFFETVKRRIDKISSYEDEKRISPEEYEKLSAQLAAGTRPIVKRRHRFVFQGNPIEIDVYPEWKNSAIMETELSNREDEVGLPSYIVIKREVSGVFEYSNAAMSRRFPEEE